MMEQHREPDDELLEVLLCQEQPEKTCKIGASLTREIRTELVKFLHLSKDVFSWSHDDMSGIDPSILVHHLNIDPTFK